MYFKQTWESSDDDKTRIDGHFGNEASYLNAHLMHTTAENCTLDNLIFLFTLAGKFSYFYLNSKEIFFFFFDKLNSKEMLPKLNGITLTNKELHLASGWIQLVLEDAKCIFFI